MGANNGTEQGIVFLTGNFTGTGQSASQVVKGYYNFSLWGTFSATARLERSFDGGTTWIPVSLDALGDYVSYTQPVSVTGFECENGVLYRVNDTAYVSGTVNYRLSGPNYGSNEGVQSIIA